MADINDPELTIDLPQAAQEPYVVTPLQRLTLGELAAPAITEVITIPQADWGNIIVDPNFNNASRDVVLRSVINDDEFPVEIRTIIRQNNGRQDTYTISPNTAGYLSQLAVGFARFAIHTLPPLDVPPPSNEEDTRGGLLCYEELLLLRNEVLLRSSMCCGVDNPSLLLTYFAGLPRFRQEYAVYMENPDDGVTFSVSPANVEDDSAELTALIAALPPQVEGQRGVNQTLLNAIIHLSAIITEKRFDTDMHREQFLTKRLSSLASNMQSPNYLYDRLNAYLPRDALNNVSACLSFYPKLKTRIFSLILVNVGVPFLSHTRSLLAFTGMTTVHLIHEMLFNEIKCVGLTNFTILGEIKKFYIAYNRAYEKFGQKLVYMRLLSPQDTTLNATQWPNLAALAYYFNMKESRNLSQYKFNTRGISVSNLIRLAVQRLNPTTQVGEVGRQAENPEERYNYHRNLLYQLGIKPNVFINNARQLEHTEQEMTDIDRNIQTELLNLQNERRNAAARDVANRLGV
jgi:hypothetical protein